MNRCCWCGQTVGLSLTVSDVFSFSRLTPEARCRSCAQKLVSIDPKSACPGCSRNQETAGWCMDCLKWKKQYPHKDFSHTALYAYEGLIREWLQAYKFKGDYRLASFFRSDLRQAIRSLKPIDIIIPIPVSEASLRKRGFNQVEGLLQAASVSFLPVLEHLGKGKKQSEKKRAERMNSPQPFQVKEAFKEQIKNKRVLIVDDVYTTGRTIFHAREVLEKEKIAQIQTFTLAR